MLEPPWGRLERLENAGRMVGRVFGEEKGSGLAGGGEIVRDVKNCRN